MKKLLFFVTNEVAHVSVRKAAAVGSQRRQQSLAFALRNCLEVLKQQDKYILREEVSCEDAV